MSQVTQGQATPPPASGAAIALAVGFRAAVFAGLWAILNSGDGESWLLGAPVVVVAALLSVAVLPPARWNARPIGALRFVVYFLSKSVLSSVDVALRVLAPRMRLKPGIIRYPFRLPTDGTRVIMADTASLLPGTLSVGIDGDELVIHALDTRLPVMEELRELEARVAAIYGISLGEQ